MYSAPVLALKFLAFYSKASNGKGHGIHSPFVFEFISKLLNDTTQYESYRKIENLRKKLQNDPRMLAVDDFGAGTAFSHKHKRSIKSIARNAAKSRKYGQLLFRMVRYYQPKIIIEMGTSLGITTSYLSMANENAKLLTLEGAKEIAEVALQNFQKLSVKNIELVEGNFDTSFPPLLGKLTHVDFAFIDGNHRREPTERYFRQLLPLTHNDSILIFDDIHWSLEMEQAWSAIKDHSSVCCSIDLFFIGIILFRREFKEKQHFSVRF